MRVAFLTTDNREQLAKYELDLPFFGTAPAALLDGFSYFPGEVEIHVISCAKEKMAAPEKLAPNIWFHQPIVPHAGWGRSMFIGCGLAVRHVIRDLGVDLVHAQGTERDCAVSMMLAPSMPRLLTIHGHMARIAEVIRAKPFSYYWLVKHLEALAIRRADGVVAITHYTRGRIEARTRQTWVVPNAVDTSFFDVNSPAKGRMALCVASLSPWKRQLELIHALDLLSENERPHLVLLGSGEKSDYGRKVVAAVQGREWCEYVGAVSHADLKNWLRMAALLILPSTEDNCPMVVLEAMAAGVPVAASAIGGIPDLIEDGVTGFLFNPQDPESMRAVISKWAQNPHHAASVAATANHAAAARFHPKMVAVRHLEIYRQVIGEEV